MLFIYDILAVLDIVVFFFFQAEDGIRDRDVTGVQTCALPILICPSPKLPTRRSPPKAPKLAGAIATPQGEFNCPRVATRRRNVPLVSNRSTKPWPWPATSSF